MYGAECKSHFVAGLGSAILTLAADRTGRSLWNWVEKHDEGLTSDGSAALTPDNVAKVSHCQLLPTLQLDGEALQDLFREVSQRPDLRALSASQALPSLNNLDLLVRPLVARTSTPVEYEISKAIRGLAGSVDQTIQFNGLGERVGHILSSCRVAPAWVQQVKASGTVFEIMLWLAVVHIKQSDVQKKTSIMN